MTPEDLAQITFTDWLISMWWVWALLAALVLSAFARKGR